VDLHPSSTVEVDYTCEACDVVRYKRFFGIEKKNSRCHVPRTPGEGLFFRRSDLGGAGFFKPRHAGFRLCTQQARVFIEEQQYTNVEFMEVGELLPD